MNKREFIKTGSIVAVGLASLKLNASSKFISEGFKGFTIPKLAYSEKDIETIFTASSFNKHYKIYSGFNESLNSEIFQSLFTPDSVRSILQNSNNYSSTLVNSACGYYNHKMFFKLIQPNKTTISSVKLAESIKVSFGSKELMNKQIIQAGENLNTNGWLWLVYQNGKLRVVSSTNNQNPMQSTSPIEQKGFPILCIDLFDHAYQKDYGLDKHSYMNTVLENINWPYAEKRFIRAQKFSQI